MPLPRLTQQYIRLYQLLGATTALTSLQTLADGLHCTRRHMRNLLRQMQAQGWIDWQAQPGRGGRSRLALLRSIDSLQRERAEHLLAQGRIVQAADLIDGREALSALLLSRLGQRWEQGRQVLTVPYYRPLLDLHPALPLRRTERHLASQIFNGLTRHHDEKGEIEGDLAHHWQQASPLVWHFHLRPAVRWHDGSLLTVEQVVEALQRLPALPLYRHWRAVRALSPRSLAIELAEPDPWLPWLLADPCAMITPPAVSSCPLGTGPYRVLDNDRYQLRLQAFDDYFGYRALLDAVDILIVPDWADGVALHERRSACELQVRDQTGTASPASDEMVCEQGCHFLLFDSRSPRMRSPALRQWLNRELALMNLIADLPPPVRRYCTQASGLLPRWFHTPPVDAAETPPAGTTLRMAYHADQPDYPLVMEVMARRLAAFGVTLTSHCVSYADWDQGRGDFDLWQGSVNFSGNPDYTVAAWLLGTPLVWHCLGGEAALPLSAWHAAWRRQEMTAQQLAAEVVRHGWLLPLFHHWFRLQGSHRMQGVRLNSLGWFDFKSAWLVP